MVAACAVLTIVVVVLAIVVVRMRRRLETAAALEEERSQQLQTAQEELRDVEAAKTATGRERDEALARAQRVRRDAADVAKRLEDLNGEHEKLVTERDELRSERDELGSELDELRRRPAPSEVASMDGELVWALTLARLDRLWRVSVASGTETTSPLMASDSLLEDALEVVAAAAREEAGAIVDATYTGSGDVEGSAAATVVGLVEELVASAVDMADETQLIVEVTDSDVFVSITATVDGDEVRVPGPRSLLDDGRYRIGRVRD